MTPPTWYRQARFLFHLEYRFSLESYGDPFPGLDAQEVRETLSRIRPDAVQLVVKDHAGYVPYQSNYGNSLPGLGYAGGPDLVQVYRDVTRELEIPLVLGSGGLIDRRAAETRPDWRRLDRYGHAYANRALCPNGGYVEELLLPQLEELTSAYRPEGVWLDAGGWTVSPCYCSACETEFQMQHGRSAPLGRRESYWDEWLAFHRESYFRYLERVGRYLQDHCGDLAFSAAGAFGAAEPIPLRGVVNRLSLDVSPAFSLRQAGLECRVLDDRGLPFDVMTWNRCSARPWPQGSLPALPVYPKGSEHLCQEGSVILANGGRWTLWLTATAAGELPTSEIAGAAEAAEYARTMAAAPPGRSAAYVAVLHSAATHHRVGNGLFDPGPCLDRIRGAHQALQELQHPHDIITESTLEQCLDRYRVLILPECTALPLAIDAVIRDWVAGGGLLVATGRVSPRLNEDVPTYALEDVLGVQWTGGRRSEGYLLFQGHSILAPAPVWEVRCESARPLYSLVEESRHGRHEVDGYPAATTNDYGKGRACYLAWDFFAAYHRSQYPGLRDILGDVFSHLLPDPPLAVDLPASIEVVLRCREDSGDGDGLSVLEVNFLNHSPGKSLAQNSPFIESVPTCEGFPAAVKAAGTVIAVTLEPEGRPLDWSESEGRVTFHVPAFHLWSRVAIRYRPAAGPPDLHQTDATAAAPDEVPPPEPVPGESETPPSEA